MTERNCKACGSPIKPERLEILTDTQYCTKCADKHTPPKIHNPQTLCLQASPSGQNGFSPKS